MCGIAGIISKSTLKDDKPRTTVEKMVQSLQHRGPDDEGFHLDEKCVLGMRRLSIIDLMNGEQPKYNETKEILVFQNGEIYNYLDLKEQLQSKGHVFTSNSDTEVLVHLYEEYGLDMFGQLNGMYAFCLYDKANERFILARDNFGEKPLYYSDGEDHISFSSEITSLLENSEIDRQLSKEALGYYLRTSLVPSPITLFREVKQLPPGHHMIIQRGVAKIEKHFTLSYKINPDITTVEEASELVRPKLNDAINRQSISDVPVGSFLSGGIDSSTLVALRQKQSTSPIMTFNVRFEEDSYDESAIARKVADHCRTDHHEVVIPNQGFTEDIFWGIIDHIGQPFRDSSAIPTYQISKEMSKHVKVAISGDGGDEMFGGYSLFHWYTRILRLQKIPLHLRNFAQVSTKVLKAARFPAASKLRQINRVLETAKLSQDEIAIALNEMFTASEMRELLVSNQDSISDFQLLKTLPDSSSSWTDLRKIMHYRTQHTLTNNMLVKVDSMSMANSLEVRAPFLDQDLAEMAAQLHDQFLMKGSVGKVVLREMMSKELPLEVFNHPKQGFNIPLHSYQNDAFKTLAKRLLFEENPLPDLFKKEALEQIFMRGLAPQGNQNNLSVFRASHHLWMIMQLLGWAHRFKVKMN